MDLGSAVRAVVAVALTGLIAGCGTGSGGTDPDGPPGWSSLQERPSSSPTYRYPTRPTYGYTSRPTYRYTPRPTYTYPSEETPYSFPPTCGFGGDVLYAPVTVPPPLLPTW